MNDFINFVSTADNSAVSATGITEACQCLDQFTDHFNARNLAGMDEELHFPHLLISGADCVTWATPGQHPSNFFEELEKTGWDQTVYESKNPVLTSPDKIHFVVTYSRRNARNEVISLHTNLWILLNSNGRWRIVARSY